MDANKKLGFGLMRLPLLDKDDYGSVDIEAFKKMADAFMEAGFTYYDTAYGYHLGNSEVAFGEAVAKRYPRESFTITDKMPVYDKPTKEGMVDIFNEQLRRCCVDYFDYYWVHCVDSAIITHTEEIDAFGFIQKMKEEGKILHTGFSFHDTADCLDTILTRHPEVEFVQLQINYLDWDDPDVQSRLCYEVCQKHGKKVIVMEPVRGGDLARLPQPAEEIMKAYDPSVTEASWALRFAASLPDVVMVLSGMTEMSHVTENVKLMDHVKPISEEDNEMLKKVAEVIHAGDHISCTACRYCTKECPMQISIPDYFGIYNKAVLVPKRKRGDLREEYKNQSEKGGAPKDCIACGACASRCPQHIDIPRRLVDVRNALET